MSATVFCGLFNEDRQRKMKREGEGNGRRGGESERLLRDNETMRDG